MLFQRVDHGLKLVSLGLTVRGIEHAGLHHDHHGFSLINRQSGVKETLPQLVLKNVSRVVNLLLPLLGRADTIDGQQALESSACCICLSVLVTFPARSAWRREISDGP